MQGCVTRFRDSTTRAIRTRRLRRQSGRLSRECAVIPEWPLRVDRRCICLSQAARRQCECWKSSNWHWARARVGCLDGESTHYESPFCMSLT
eukprot:scaffold274807_cov28-Tisochrysis_lutea.AAC.2